MPSCQLCLLSPTALPSEGGEFTQRHKPRSRRPQQKGLAFCSPAFSYQDITSVSLTSVISHRKLLVRWDLARLPGVTDTNLLGYKDVRSPVCPNAFHIKQQEAASSLQGGHPFSHRSVAGHLLPFSLTLSSNPTGPRGCSWLQGLAGSLGSQTATGTTPTRALRGAVARQPRDRGFPTGAAPVCTQTSLGAGNRVTA